MSGSLISVRVRKPPESFFTNANHQPLLAVTNRDLYRLNKIISARSHSFLLYSEPIYQMTSYYRDEMRSREVCYSSANEVRFMDFVMTFY